MNPQGNGASDGFAELRRIMVEKQIQNRGGFSARVLEAMLAVPRHEFVPLEHRAAAYNDQPLPIGEGQTISQPFMVAAMTEALELARFVSPAGCVLEVGTGSGYQAAVLSLLSLEVHTIECIEGHARAAAERLARLGYANVRVHVGDGTLGLPEAAPFDGIVVTAAAPGIPPALVEQLADGGRLVIPVGDKELQDLVRLVKSGEYTSQEILHQCRFVPLVGRQGWREWPGLDAP